jgi:hypothetical protein
MHAILNAVALSGARSADEQLLATLKRVRGAHDRFVDEPVELLPKTWPAWALDDKGRCGEPAWSSGCGSSHETRCVPGDCFARSGVATPIRQGP